MSTPPLASNQPRTTSAGVPSDSEQNTFTRGEKCIFTHLIVTFSIILLCVIIFSIHLILVKHTKDSILQFYEYRRIGDAKPIEKRDLPLGYLYLTSERERGACNALLLRRRWSVGPGHCAAMRSDPAMAHLLHAWRIVYRTPRMEYTESEIKRSVPHPHFDRYDFSNNIGVFQHDPIDIEMFVFPESFTLNDVELLQNSNKFKMIGWEKDITDDNNAGARQLRSYIVTAVAPEKCQRFMLPIVDLRPYEFCVILKTHYDVYPEHGAILLMDSNTVGFFSWGERGGKGVPFIVINILHYREWLENMVSISTFS